MLLQTIDAMNPWKQKEKKRSNGSEAYEIWESDLNQFLCSTRNPRLGILRVIVLSFAIKGRGLDDIPNDILIGTELPVKEEVQLRLRRVFPSTSSNYRVRWTRRTAYLEAIGAMELHPRRW